jgi:hypothetical protein
MAKGQHEETFQAIVAELAKTTKAYDARSIKHYQWAESIDNIFERYGWSKAEFHKELRSRLGIQTNESREKTKPKPKTKSSI